MEIPVKRLSETGSHQVRDLILSAPPNLKIGTATSRVAVNVGHVSTVTVDEGEEKRRRRI
jgi:hypothetical protein